MENPGGHPEHHRTELPPTKEHDMTTNTHCNRCHRPLTSAKSIKKGYGPTCAQKIRNAPTSDFKAEQIAKAHELIEDGGVVHLKSKVFQTVSTDGTEIYKTAPTACTCPAGIKGQHVCFHIAAVRLMLAA